MSAGVNSLDAHVGYRIQKARERVELTIDDVARHLEIPLHEYRLVEDGTRRMRPEKLVQCARLFGVSLGSFFQGYGSCGKSDNEDIVENTQSIEFKIGLDDPSP